MTHTPGPWHREANTIVKRGQDGQLVMNIIGMSGVSYRRQGREAVDNLKLIAAAPDMLKALEMAKDYLYYGSLHHHKQEVIKAIIEAVNLATKGS